METASCSHFCWPGINHLQQKLFPSRVQVSFLLSSAALLLQSGQSGLTLASNVAQHFFLLFSCLLLERTLIYCHRFPFYMNYKVLQLSVMQLHSQSLRKLITILKALLQVLLSKITSSSNNSLCVFVSSFTNPTCLFLNPCLLHFESISALLILWTTLFFLVHFSLFCGSL